MFSSYKVRVALALVRKGGGLSSYERQGEMKDGVYLGVLICSVVCFTLARGSTEETF